MRFRIWWLMVAVAIVAMILVVRHEFNRMRQRRVEAEIRQLAQGLKEYGLKYPRWSGCRGPIYVEPCRSATNHGRKTTLDTRHRIPSPVSPEL